jgi:hypothetical protein
MYWSLLEALGIQVSPTWQVELAGSQTSRQAPRGFTTGQSPQSSWQVLQSSPASVLHVPSPQLVVGVHSWQSSLQVSQLSPASGLHTPSPQVKVGVHPWQSLEHVVQFSPARVLHTPSPQVTGGEVGVSVGSLPPDRNPSTRVLPGPIARLKHPQISKNPSRINNHDLRLSLVGESLSVINHSPFLMASQGQAWHGTINHKICPHYITLCSASASVRADRGSRNYGLLKRWNKMGRTFYPCILFIIINQRG